MPNNKTVSPATLSATTVDGYACPDSDRTVLQWKRRPAKSWKIDLNKPLLVFATGSEDGEAIEVMALRPINHFPVEAFSSVLDAIQRAYDALDPLAEKGLIQDNLAKAVMEAAQGYLDETWYPLTKESGFRILIAHRWNTHLVSKLFRPGRPTRVTKAMQKRMAFLSEKKEELKV
jgi:hypothetical protein